MAEAQETSRALEHAWILTGWPGSGKTTLGQQLVRRRELVVGPAHVGLIDDPWTRADLLAALSPSWHEVVVTQPHWRQPAVWREVAAWLDVVWPTVTRTLVVLDVDPALCAARDAERPPARQSFAAFARLGPQPLLPGAVHLPDEAAAAHWLTSLELETAEAVRRPRR